MEDFNELSSKIEAQFIFFRQDDNNKEFVLKSKSIKEYIVIQYYQKLYIY